MSKILVVYYSRTGTTRGAAEAIAAACQADLEEIRDIRPRRGVIGWIRSLIESLRHGPADIHPVRFDPTKYELVVLGTPVWASSMSSPLRRYLTDQRSRLPEVAIFVTEGGRGGDKAAGHIAALCGRSPRGIFLLTRSDLKSR